MVLHRPVELAALISQQADTWAICAVLVRIANLWGAPDEAGRRIRRTIVAVVEVKKEIPV
jgi:hypothetical protein